MNISLRSKIDIFSAMLRLLEHNFDPKLNYYLLLYICIHKDKVEDKIFSHLFSRTSTQVKIQCFTWIKQSIAKSEK